MFEKLANIFRIPDLRKRVLFTLAMLAVYRLGGHLPTPGVNFLKLEDFFNQNRGSLLGFVDLFSGISVVNAGHNPGFLVSPGGGSYQFDAAGTPLGLLPGMQYASEKRSFCPGARLLFYTDGLTEVFKGDEEFGPERLLNEFSKCPPHKADDILDALWTTLDEFSSGGPQSDDMTALALCRWRSNPEMPA